MVDRRAKLQQLLDGELDPSEIISDPTPVSYTHLTLPTIYSV